MGKRATITDLAREAGVSVATVDRVLNRRLPVREDTALRVVAAAESIGYHATGLLKQRMTEVKPCTMGFLLQKRGDDFYQALANELLNATKATSSIRGKAVIEFMDELVPSFIAAKIRDIGARVDVLAVVAVDHPLVSEAVEEIVAKGKPVFTLLSDLTTPAARWIYCRGCEKSWPHRRLDHIQAGKEAGKNWHPLGKPPLPQSGNGRDQFQELHARECAPVPGAGAPGKS